MPRPADTSGPGAGQTAPRAGRRVVMAGSPAPCHVVPSPDLNRSPNPRVLNVPSETEGGTRRRISLLVRGSVMLSPSRFAHARRMATGFASLALVLATGCSSMTGNSGSSRADADRGGRSPAGDTSVGRRDGGTDRVRTARGEVQGDARDSRGNRGNRG